MIAKEEPQGPIRVDREQFLAKLTPTDKTNLLLITKLFNQVIRKHNRNGQLLVVGGTIVKSLPRKDIDVLVVFDPNSEDNLSNENTLTRYQRALIDFSTFEIIIKEIIRNQEFEIVKTIRPAIDEEHQLESILKHSGSITITGKQGGIPMEFIRIEQRGVDRFIREIDKPYVQL